MITPEKIDEWIREIEERPSSALIIVRYMANRLSDLTRRKEELLAENIQLRTTQKMDEYEARIAALEYQLETLKRQFGGGPTEPAAPTQPETISLLVYNLHGEVLRLEVDPGALVSGQVLAHASPDWGKRADGAPAGTRYLLAAPTQEELLFLFDSGRTSTLAAATIPPARDPLAARQAYLEEPRGNEDLAAIIPIGRAALADCCVQSSRRGCVKKIQRAVFETNVAKNFVGSGVKLPSDRTCGLTLCARGDRFILASREGWLAALETDQLAFAIEDSIRLSSSDHITASFALGRKPLLIFITHNGKVLQREVSWLEPAASSRSRGQAVFSAERRQAGTRLAGAAAASPEDWCAVLDQAGNLTVYAVAELLGAGSVFSGQTPGEVAAFAVFERQPFDQAAR